MLSKKEHEGMEDYFVTVEKARKSKIYSLVKKAINAFAEHGGDEPISVPEFFEEIVGKAQDEISANPLPSFKIENMSEYAIGVVALSAEGKEEGRLTINFKSSHGDKCPKLRCMFDAINGDEGFEHFAVILDNHIYIDRIEATREYADRLISKSANLVLRVAAIAKKCPLEDPEDEQKADVDTESKTA